MTTQAKVLLTGIAVFLIAIAAFMLIGTNSGKAPGSAQPEQASSDPQAPVARTGLADSSDKVRLNLAEGGKALIGETGEIVLTLDIEPGWHVNANPASMEFLIPTVAKSSAGGQSLDQRVVLGLSRGCEGQRGDRQQQGGQLAHGVPLRTNLEIAPGGPGHQV